MLVSSQYSVIRATVEVCARDTDITKERVIVLWDVFRKGLQVDVTTKLSFEE